MNRPIKFIAWDKEEGCWIPQNQIAITGEGIILTQEREDGWLSEVIPIDLYQFTGLLDKDGKEIYEGHIVVIDDMSTPMIVVYQAPSFVMKEKLTSKRWSEFVIHYEHEQLQTIIGHIAEGE